MASYQAPGASLVALLRTQLEGLDGKVLSAEARRCLVGYARHLERKALARDGDHLVAGLLLNAAEMAAYIPSGKLGKGSVELTRLQERIERAQTAARRAEQRPRRNGGRGEAGRHRSMPPPGGWRTPPTRQSERVPVDEGEGRAGAGPAGETDDSAA